jgi:hypothetical protein
VDSEIQGDGVKPQRPRESKVKGGGDYGSTVAAWVIRLRHRSICSGEAVERGYHIWEWRQAGGTGCSIRQGWGAVAAECPVWLGWEAVGTKCRACECMAGLLWCRKRRIEA